MVTEMINNYTSECLSVYHVFLLPPRIGIRVGQDDTTSDTSNQHTRASPASNPPRK